MAEVTTPRIEIKLVKTMDRQNGLAKRYEGARRERDLTPYLYDQGMVHVTKSLYSPAGGFTITFPDQPDPDVSDTLYALIEPMDVIEIRMGRGHGEIPIVMRGFVQRIGRAETILPDGSPQRIVLVQGHDYGAVFHWFQVIWNKAYMEAAASEGKSPLLTVFKLQDLTSGEPVPMQPAGDAMKSIVLLLANGWLKGLDALHKDNAVLELGADTDQATEGSISALFVGAHEGDLWSLIAHIGDLDWMEFFVEDREDKPWCVYRPKPWRDAYTGKLIMPGAKEPGTVEMDALYLRSSNLGHSGEQVANWYWVESTIDLLNPQRATIETMLRGTASVEDQENCDPRLFGARKRTAISTQWGTLTYRYPSELGYASREDHSQAQANWRGIRRDQLIALHKDNSVFEEGVLAMRGDPRLQVGKYLKLTRGSFTSEYYMTGVDHMFMPMRDWATSVQVERGTGLLNRMKEKGSPIWMEGRPGAY